MATKIEGYADLYGPEQNIAADFYMSKEFAGDTSRNATLVIHDGDPEQVFTEGEVKAMLWEMMSQPGVDKFSAQTIKNIAARSNIKL